VWSDSMYPPHGNNSSTTIRHQNTLTESTIERIYGIFAAIVRTIKVWPDRLFCHDRWQGKSVYASSLAAVVFISKKCGQSVCRL
jgi:hypothetical protein